MRGVIACLGARVTSPIRLTHTTHNSEEHESSQGVVLTKAVAFESSQSVVLNKAVAFESWILGLHI